MQHRYCTLPTPRAVIVSANCYECEAPAAALGLSVLFCRPVRGIRRCPAYTSASVSLSAACAFRLLLCSPVALFARQAAAAARRSRTRAEQIGYAQRASQRSQRLAVLLRFPAVILLHCPTTVPPAVRNIRYRDALKAGHHRRREGGCDRARLRGSVSPSLTDRGRGSACREQS